MLQHFVIFLCSKCSRVFLSFFLFFLYIEVGGDPEMPEGEGAGLTTRPSSQSSPNEERFGDGITSLRPQRTGSYSDSCSFLWCHKRKQDLGGSQVVSSGCFCVAATFHRFKSTSSRLCLLVSFEETFVALRRFGCRDATVIVFAHLVLSLSYF